MTRILPSVLLGILVAACGGGSDGAASSAAPASSSSASDAGADPAAGDSGAPQGDAGCTKGAADQPDDTGADTNCDGADGVVGVDVYVDGTSGLDTNLGTPSSPLKTVDQALTIAAQRHGHVLVASGTYALDSIGAVAEWSVFGGYAKSFTGAPKRALTVLSVSENGLLVTASPHAHLAHVTVTAADATKSAQPSSYGIRSSAALLELDDVVVKAGDGLAGATGKNGTDGAVGADGMTTCNGIARPKSANGAYGAEWSAEGEPPGDVIARVAPGHASAGAPGMDGTDSSADLNLKDGFLTIATGGSGTVGGVGFGGAGGGGGTFGTTIQSGPYAGFVVYGGTGGAAGCPGSGGDGGVSGGHSVALLVLAGNVAITRSALTTGLGGRGGDGGAGGRGGSGQPGGIPTLGPKPPNAPDPPQYPIAPGTVCDSAASDVMTLNCAAFGARGGKGGDGGHGGGGAGGASIGIVIAAGASANVDAATSITEGRAGDGGVGSSNQRAASGKRAAQIALK